MKDTILDKQMEKQIEKNKREENLEGKGETERG